MRWSSKLGKFEKHSQNVIIEKWRGEFYKIDKKILFLQPSKGCCSRKIKNLFISMPFKSMMLNFIACESRIHKFRVNSKWEINYIISANTKLRLQRFPMFTRILLLALWRSREPKNNIALKFIAFCTLQVAYLNVILHRNCVDDCSRDILWSERRHNWDNVIVGTLADDVWLN